MVSWYFYDGSPLTPWKVRNLLNNPNFFCQCLHQKSEVEQKLSSITRPSDVTSTETQVLVKHLQEELRNYVSFSFPWELLLPMVQVCWFFSLMHVSNNHCVLGFVPWILLRLSFQSFSIRING